MGGVVVHYIYMYHFIYPWGIMWGMLFSYHAISNLLVTNNSRQISRGSVILKNVFAIDLIFGGMSISRLPGQRLQ